MSDSVTKYRLTCAGKLCDQLAGFKASHRAPQRSRRDYLFWLRPLGRAVELRDSTVSLRAKQVVFSAKVLTSYFILCFLLFLSTALSCTYAQEQDELVVLSPHWEGIRREFAAAFEEHWAATHGRPLRLRWLDVGGASDIIKFLKSRYAQTPEGVGVDAMFGGGVDPFMDLKKLGFLEPMALSSEIDDGIPSDVSGSLIKDPDRTWVAASINGFGILFNKTVLARLGLTEPDAWESASRVEFFSWSSVADPRKSGSAHTLFEIILQAYGWERGWRVLLAIAANSRGFAAVSTQIPKDVASGEVALGFSIDTHVDDALAAAGPGKIGFVVPAHLSALLGDAMAVLKGAPHREAAQEFVRFVLSDEGQRIFLLPKGARGGPKQFTLGRMSVRPDLYRTEPNIAAHWNPFSGSGAAPFNSSKSAARWALMNDLFGAFLIDPHAELRQVARHARESGQPLEELVHMPISESAITEIVAAKRWENQEYRNRTIASWSSAARGMYAPYQRDSIILKLLRLLPGLILLAGLGCAVRKKFSRSRLGQKLPTPKPADRP